MGLSLLLMLTLASPLTPSCDERLTSSLDWLWRECGWIGHSHNFQLLSCLFLSRVGRSGPRWLGIRWQTSESCAASVINGAFQAGHVWRLACERLSMRGRDTLDTMRSGKTLVLPKSGCRLH
ncbi:hypothetical protein HDK90DRAFT_143386 [Phyllosticta capitalensis]|uniref:Secreted protein n=1 Tax=Phyllosticta capitalensis TaxID=121624 RepID=A0ABR1YZ91_9PEZI